MAEDIALQNMERERWAISMNENQWKSCLIEHFVSRIRAHKQHSNRGIKKCIHWNKPPSHIYISEFIIIESKIIQPTPLLLFSENNEES